MTQLWHAWRDDIRMTEAMTLADCEAYVRRENIPGQLWEICPAEEGMNVGPRSKEIVHKPDEFSRGTSRIWTRKVYGIPYSFTHVEMPDGEWRMFVSKYNGYVGGPKFACAWTRVHAWTVKPQQNN